MSILDQPPKLINLNWLQWAQRTSAWLALTRSALRHKLTGESAAEDGVLLWDAVEEQPVVSLDGAYVPIVLRGGYGAFTRTTDATVTTINTATTIPLDSTSSSEDIALGTPTSRVVFADAGIYMLSFSAQLTSSNASVKTVWFWPRVNGVDAQGSTIKVSIKENNTTTVLSRTQIFNVLAGDYLEIMWASSDLAVKLQAVPATAFAPSTPSVVLTAARIRQL